ncbi:MAG: hypothetical protein NTX09_13615 [Verrucomicrobia bacterium]|nr:hypothetical protein [Verrucomicrobiota bacterium]
MKAILPPLLTSLTSVDVAAPTPSPLAEGARARAVAPRREHPRRPPPTGTALTTAGLSEDS